VPMSIFVRIHPLDAGRPKDRNGGGE